MVFIVLMLNIRNLWAFKQFMSIKHMKFYETISLKNYPETIEIF